MLATTSPKTPYRPDPFGEINNGSDNGHYGESATTRSRSRAVSLGLWSQETRGRSFRHLEKNDPSQPANWMTPHLAGEVTPELEPQQRTVITRDIKDGHRRGVDKRIAERSARHQACPTILPLRAPSRRSVLCGNGRLFAFRDQS